MSNPYDFTSGFLAVKGLQEQRAQAQDLANYRKEAIQLQRDELAQNKPYKEAVAANYTANARKTNLDADTIERGNRIAFPILDRIADKLNKPVGLRAGGLDFSS